MASTAGDEIVGASDGWAIAQGTDTSGGYLAKEAAVATASNAIKAGHGANSVEGASEGEPVLGTRQP
jgi:hypothetical protein